MVRNRLAPEELESVMKKTFKELCSGFRHRGTDGFFGLPSQKTPNVAF